MKRYKIVFVTVIVNQNGTVQTGQAQTDGPKGYIDVGDGCWRRKVLVTTLRCWWRF